MHCPIAFYSSEVGIGTIADCSSLPNQSGGHLRQGASGVGQGFDGNSLR